jgi:hypothetical protein
MENIMELATSAKVKNLTATSATRSRVKPGYGRNYLIAAGQGGQREQNEHRRVREAPIQYEGQRRTTVLWPRNAQGGSEGASVTIRRMRARRQVVRVGRSARHRGGVQRRRSSAGKERKSSWAKARCATGEFEVHVHLHADVHHDGQGCIG